MIREVEPLTEFTLSHGMCVSCYRRMRASEPIMAEYADKVQFYRRLFSAADRRDAEQCAALVQHAQDAGFSTADIMVSLIQPALHELEQRWNQGVASDHDKRHFAAWCRGVLALFERAGTASGPLDLLILQAPGNHHDLGPRIAEQLLVERGVRARAVVDELPRTFLIRLCLELKPRFVGFSCAVFAAIESALSLASELHASGFRGGVILSGQAFRRHPQVFHEPGLHVCTTVEQARQLVLDGPP
jgi:methanogenic corrinoid protein MtbC1